MSTSRERKIEYAKFSTDVYSLETVKKAAYTFLNRANIDISIDGNVINVAMEPLSSPSHSDEDDGAKQLSRDFRNEVLDQDLRKSIADETEDIRSGILGLAFSNTNLQDK